MTYDASDDSRKSYDLAVAANREKLLLEIPGVKRARVIGRCELLQGDNAEILPNIGGIDALLTDPPYSVSTTGSSASFTRAGKKGTRNYNFFAGDDDWAGMEAKVRAAISCATSSLPLTVVVWCGHRQFGGIVSDLETAGYKTRPLIWRKLCPPPAPPGAGFASGAEIAVYGYLPGRPWHGVGNESNVFLADGYRHGNPGKVAHPTQKPLALIEWNIRCLTDPDSTVLDCWMGSGTTLVACAKLGRRGIGIELDPDYFDIACKRVTEAYRQPDLFVSQPAPAPVQEGLDL